MKHLSTLAVCATMLALPVTAQSPDPDAGSDSGTGSDLGQGMDLLSQGSRLLLRGLMAEIEPALRDLEGALQDMNAYQAPEILPNGDIIIRRKVPRPTEPPVGEDGEVEL